MPPVTDTINPDKQREDSRASNSGSEGKGSTSPTISTPKGGGAISSIGEKFQANAVTGTGSMSVPIALSPGRNGFTPQLALSYDSGSGNSELGMGWSMGIPSISRKTQKGLPKYQDAKESDIFLLAGSEDLIPVLVQDNDAWVEVVSESGGFRIKQYRPRIEGLFAKIEKHTELSTGMAHWQVTTKDNITSVYGKSASARIADSQNTQRVFQWMLEYTYDEKGNIILYEYKQENNENIGTGLLSEKSRLQNEDAFTKAYLKAVKYTPDIPFDTADTDFFSTVHWHFQLVLDYGEHTDNTVAEDVSWPMRQDPHSTFRSGFEIRTYRLCHRFLMFHHFEAELGSSPYLVKSTEITYDENPVATRIASVKHVCHQSGESPLDYPPVTFTYSAATIDPNIYQHSIEDLKNLPAGVEGQYRWADLFGEGLSGVLMETPQAWYYKKNLGDENYYKNLPANETPLPQARLAPLAEVLEKPSLSGGQLGDVDGNGLPDYSVNVGGLQGYYALGADGRWERFRPFESNPVIDWNDPDLRRIDLDGDGFADLLITRDHCLVCYPSLAEKGFAPSYQTLQSFDEEKGPRVIFSDPEQSVYLADMSGDGLTDIVRIRNGSVCYWPNKGYGRFGAKVAMDHAPWFDHEDIFNQQRIRLADVDGSGTMDIIYIAADGIKYFPNQSGNSFGQEIFINQRLPTHNLAQIATLDILGDGTDCIVWSSPMLGDHPPALKYLRLMGEGKPYLLTEVNNNMGLVTRMKYAPSTKFYLRDQRNGTPWITKLPFPVLVVERVETWDEVNRNRFVSKYAYHHGYFDGVEREFRGFGMVEQWDTEDFTDFIGEGLFPPGYNATEEVLHVPPVHTKTWFHVGHDPYLTRHPGFAGGGAGVGQIPGSPYRNEYWSGDEDAFTLAWDSFVVPEGTPRNDGQLVREAARALKGSPLRQEVYSQDGSEAENNPYVVTENTYDIQMVQPRGSERRDRDYASFLVIPAETLTYHYERNPADPRVSHQLTLETDEYGQALKAAAVVYPRRGTGNYAEQDVTLITIAENTLINKPDAPGFYRLGVPAESKNYELTGFTPGLQTITGLLAAFDNADEISFESAPTTGIEKRLLSHSRILYYDETLTSTPLSLGSVASHALPFETYQLALTAGQISGTLNEASITRVDSSVLSEGEYVDLLSDGNQWVPSGKMTFDAAHFFLPTTQIDPFGNETLFGYDANHLLLVSTTDALGNEVSAQYDYRLLQPDLVTDPNGNRQAFAFDVRGMVTKLAVMGKVGDSDGDDLTDPTTEFSYDLFAWTNNQKPNWAYTKTRETHADEETRWMESYAYSDGLGNVVMTKNKVADGLAYGRDGNGALLREMDDSLSDPVQTSPRWVGTGRTILNNKGNPVKQYEPYFSSTSDYETEAELVEYGVTPVIYYDPLGRAIRTEMPDDTLTRVEFTPWEQKNFDQNDTVLESLWYTARNSPNPAGSEPTDSDERAAFLAAQHANTPQIIILDLLGRPFITIDRLTSGTTPEDGTEGTDFYKMTTELDILSNPLSITDAKGRTSFTYTYNMLGQPIKTTHIDNGVRYAIGNVVGNPLRAWDGRKQQFRFSYDELLRPKGTYLTPDYDGTPGSEQLLQLTVYGEEVTDPEDNNLRGQAYIIFDSAGMVKNTEFDFKGNPLTTERQLATTYQTSPDWISLDGYTSISNLLSSASSLLETEVFAMSTEYDAQNRPTKMVKPDNSEVIPRYDDGGQLETVDCKLRGAGTATSFVTAILYNERGQRRYITFGNNTHTNYEYDAKTFRLIRLKTNRNTSELLQDLNYIYDTVGNIVEMKDLAQSTNYYDNSSVSADGRYEYDPLYRLTKSEGRELIGLNAAPSHVDIDISPLNETALRRYTQQYVYDELGNILQLMHTASSGNWNRYYHYAANNYLLSTSPDNDQPTIDEYDYDAHGNMTTMPHLSGGMTWDFADRLQSAANGTQASYYTYDAGGNRVRKVVDKGSGLIHERIYIGDWEVYREIQSGTVQLERETLHISDDTGRIAIVDTETTNSNAQTIRYQFSNHLGSASLELDNTAAIISYEEYHPFGTTSYRSGVSSSEVSLKRYRYVGKERDEETGLYYYGARYYAVWLCRFVSVDPLKDDYPQLNSYNYAGNKPITFKDIDGMQSDGGDKPRQVGKPIITPIEEAEGLFQRETTYRRGRLGQTVTEIINAEGEVTKPEMTKYQLFLYDEEDKKQTDLGKKSNYDRIQAIIDYIKSGDFTPTSGDGGTTGTKNSISYNDWILDEFNQHLHPNTTYMKINAYEGVKNDFTFTIITGDLGLGGGAAGSIIFIKFSEELDNIYAGKSGVLIGGSFGFNVGIGAGFGGGGGNFTTPLSTYENPLEKIVSASDFEVGFGLPVYGIVGFSVARVEGRNNDGSVFTASYSTTTLGVPLGKYISPLIDKLPFPSVQNEFGDDILSPLDPPTKQDSLRVQKRFNRN